VGVYTIPILHSIVGWSVGREGVSSPSRLLSLGERRELLSGGGAEAQPETHFGVY